MRKPRLQTSHISEYDKNKEGYTDKEKESIAAKDLKNLSLCHLMRMDDKELTFHFPSKSIHVSPYFQLFLNYVIEESIYSISDIERKTVDSLFSNPKNKAFITDILSYSDSYKDKYGIGEAIMYGTKINTNNMKFLKMNDNSMDIIADTTLYDSGNEEHSIKTVWNLDKDLVLRFVAIVLED